MSDELKPGQYRGADGKLYGWLLWHDGQYQHTEWYEGAPLCGRTVGAPDFPAAMAAGLALWEERQREVVEFEDYSRYPYRLVIPVHGEPWLEFKPLNEWMRDDGSAPLSEVAKLAKSAYRAGQASKP